MRLRPNYYSTNGVGGLKPYLGPWTLRVLNGFGTTDPIAHLGPQGRVIQIRTRT